MKRLIIFLLLGILLVESVSAACSDCSTSAPSCDTASSTALQVQTCIDSTPEGATISFNAGTGTWG